MMKKYTLIFLAILLMVLAAQDVFAGRGGSSKSSCEVDPDFKQLIQDMADNPDLARAIKQKPTELAKVWKDLEQSGEPGWRKDPDILHKFINIPTPKKGRFQEWWDALTLQQAELLWQNKKLREDIEDRLRKPPGFHEWCMVCRAPTFKKWGVTAKEIERFRIETTKLKWVTPIDTTAQKPGKAGGHGGNGSTAFHNELKQIIDTSNSYSEFRRRLESLIIRWKIEPSALHIP